MKTLRLQMQMTINGFVGGLDGRNDWMTWVPDEEFIAFMQSMLDTSDMLLLGRKTAEVIIKYWTQTANDNPAHPFAQRIVDIKKVVFSKTLEKSTWDNTTLANGNLADEIARLKKASGKDIMVFGGAAFVSSLVKEGLIDEYHFIINPTVMSQGLTIFDSLNGIQKLSPTQSKLYPGGKIVLSYKRSE
jgi:dihydrofolate reductase